MTIKAFRPREMSTESYQRLLDIAGEIVAEPDIHRLCASVLIEAQKCTGAEGGTLYLVGQDSTGSDDHLDFVIVRNTKIDLKTGKKLPPLPLFDAESGEPNHKNIATYAYHARTVVRIDDAYAEQKFDFSGTRKFDQATGYHSKSFLAVPLMLDTGKVLGVFQLINATQPESDEPVAFLDEQQAEVEVLAEFSARALEQQLATQRQRELLVKLAGQSDTGAIADQILREAKTLTNAEGGSLYLLKEGDQGARLEFSLVLNDKLNISLGGRDGDPVNLPPLHLYHEDGTENRDNVATYCALTGESVLIDDAYDDQRFDFSGTRKFDETTGYHSKSFLTVPLKNHENDVIGVLQLLNARDFNTGEVIRFKNKSQIVVEALSSFAAIALHNRILLEDLKNLLDAFIQAIAKAIDAKSSHTSAHCERVPLLTQLIAEAACADKTTFKDFDLTEEEWYELKVAAWMHDCGKLATPDSVLDKSTKLHLMRDGIKEIEARMAGVRQGMWKDYYRDLAEGGDAAKLKSQLDRKLADLDDDFEFLRAANKGGEFMSDEAKARVRQLAEARWEDVEGNEQPLITNEEVEYLCIERGTLSADERQIINDHMVVTLDILESLPFPKNLRRVPEYAGGHHEKMDGTGFPRGLTRDQMSIPARMMAIADIFEALTARERPYKAPMKLSVALGIMKRMKDSDHIDPDLFDLFVKGRVWEKYADMTLLEEQKDVTDVTPYLN